MKITSNLSQKLFEEAGIEPDELEEGPSNQSWLDKTLNKLLPPKDKSLGSGAAAHGVGTSNGGGSFSGGGGGGNNHGTGTSRAAFGRR